LESVLTVESRLVEVLAAARRRSRVRTQQYEQFWEALSRMALGGKMIRPRLLIDAHEDLGVTAAQAAMDAAGAMQLLHIGLIIHDDVIDNDTVRRGEMNITGQFSSEAMLLGATSAAAQTWGISSSRGSPADDTGARAAAGSRADPPVHFRPSRAAVMSA
jgi:geranylgeranyl pyrophosphate synthase